MVVVPFGSQLALMLQLIPLARVDITVLTNTTTEQSAVPSDSYLERDKERKSAIMRLRIHSSSANATNMLEYYALSLDI